MVSILASAIDPVRQDRGISINGASKFEVGRPESLDKRMTRMGADLRELKRAQAGLPAEKGPQTMKSIDERNHNGDHE